MIKTFKYGFLAFSGGFVLYSLCRYITSKETTLTKEQFTQFINKIRNLSIHILIKRYDSNNKIIDQYKNEDEDDDIQIIDSSKSQGPQSTLSNEEFYKESQQMVLEIESEKLRQAKMTIQQYNDYLSKYIDDPQIKRIISTMSKADQSLKLNKKPQFSFGEVIPKKYLEIICNIFYFTLKKATRRFYAERASDSYQAMTFKENNILFNQYYSAYLNTTRNEIVTFFNVDVDQLDFSPKLSLRLYPFYYDKKHPLRITYQDINDDVNRLIDFILNIPNQIEEFVNDKHPNALTSPVDKVIDFKHFMQNAQDNKLLLKTDSHEDQFD